MSYILQKVIRKIEYKSNRVKPKVKSVPVSLDWVGLSLKLEFVSSKAPEGHIWQPLGQTNVWAKRAIMRNDHGERVFTLLWEPRSTTIQSKSALLEVENEWLYHGLGVDGCLQLLAKCARFEVNGISRVDICVDFNPSRAEWNVIKGLSEKELYVSGKRSRSEFCSTNCQDWLPERYRGKEIPHCQSWGHKTTAVKWKLYYKTLENSMSLPDGKRCWAKPYIVDTWRQYGLDENDVWRLEVSIRNGNQFEVTGEVLSWPFLKANYTGIMSSLIRDRFKIRRFQGHKDRSNDKQVPFLTMIETFQSFRAKPHGIIAHRSGAITLLRHLIADAQLPEVVGNKKRFEIVINTIRQLITHDGLRKYFIAATGTTLTLWADSLRTQNEGQCVEYQGNMNNQDLKANEKFDITLGAPSSPSPGPKARNIIQTTLKLNYTE